MQSFQCGLHKCDVWTLLIYLADLCGVPFLNWGCVDVGPYYGKPLCMYSVGSHLAAWHDSRSWLSRWSKDAQGTLIGTVSPAWRTVGNISNGSYINWCLRFCEALPLPHPIAKGSQQRPCLLLSGIKTKSFLVVLDLQEYEKYVFRIYLFAFRMCSCWA